MVLVDTGSTDRTLEVATATIGKPVHVQTYTGASRQDEHGDWKLWDFGKARNVFVDEIDRRGADWALWMDADDELLTPVNLRRAFWWDQHEVYGVQIESAGQRWLHHRLWRANRGIRFVGRCHEYPTIGGHPTLALVDSVIRHDATPGIGEGANARNLRILTEEFAEDPSPRVAFYLGSTHKDAGRWREAVAAYATRIAMGEAYRDEWLFAYLYKGRCERMAGEVDAAERTLLEAVSHERSWAEYLDGARLHRVRPAAMDAIARLRIAGRCACRTADDAVEGARQVPRPAGTHRVAVPRADGRAHCSARVGRARAPRDARAGRAVGRAHRTASESRRRIAPEVTPGRARALP